MFIAEEFRDYVELGLITEGTENPPGQVIRLLCRISGCRAENEEVLCMCSKFCILARRHPQAKTHLVVFKKLAPVPDVTLPVGIGTHFEDRDLAKHSARCLPRFNEAILRIPS